MCRAVESPRISATATNERGNSKSIMAIDPIQRSLRLQNIASVIATDAHFPNDHTRQNDGERICSCSTAGCSCVPALPPPGPLHSPPPPWPMRPGGQAAQPGFYRFKLGAIEITVVSDGTLAFPPKRCGSIGRGRKRPAHIHVPAASP